MKLMKLVILMLQKKIRNNLLLIILLLVLCVGVSASIPSYNLQYNLDTEIGNGATSLGSIVFLKQPMITEQRIKNIIQPYSFEQYDTFIWTGTIPVQIIDGSSTTILDSVVSPTFIFNRVGQYTLQNTINSSQTAIITIISPDIPSINIESNSPSGIAISPSTTLVTLNGDSTVVALNTVVGDDILPDTYPISLDFISNNLGMPNQSYSFDLNVVEKELWNIESNDISTNIDAMTGGTTDIGNIKFVNTGNKDYTMKFVATGTGALFVNTPLPQNLYRKSSLTYPIQLQIPLNTVRGIYPVTLTFSGGENEDYIHNLNITVTDNILPTIDSIEFDHTYAMIENTVTVVAKDNINVNNVTLSYDDKTLIFKKDEQLFTLDTTFEKLSRYLLTLCAYDDDANKKCIDFNQTFTSVDLIKPYDFDISIPSVKFETFAKIPLFNLTKDSNDVTVKLEDLTVTGENLTRNDMDIRLIDGDGVVKKFSQYVSEIEITKAGIIYLQMTSPAKTTYTGRISFIAPDYIITPNDISFHGNFKLYDVPESFEMDWFNDEKLICTVVDTGNLDTTYYNCPIKIYGAVDTDNIPIPITPSEKRAIDEQINDIESKYQRSAMFYKVILGLLVGVFILVVGIGLLLMEYGPYMRFAFNKTEKD